MLKSERHNVILKLVNEEGVITVTKLLDQLKVSDMTIRRDLTELDESGLLVKVHGGAQSLDFHTINELSHVEKQELNIDEKREVAQISSQLIENGDTIFLGTGTTIELMADYMNFSYLRIVTNSLPVFEKFKGNANYETYLIGGVYRERTGAFIGSITTDVIRQLKFEKAFIGANAIHNNFVYTANIEEGNNQRVALDNSFVKIIVADHHKLDKENFNSFYQLKDADLLVVDSGIEKEQRQTYKKFVDIISSVKEI